MIGTVRWRLRCRALSACLCLWVSACASGGTGEGEVPIAAVPSTESAPLEPGDKLRVTFSREPNLNGEYAIDENGIVVLPLLDARSVTGVSSSEVIRELQAEFDTRVRNQQVQIVPLRRVRVLGEVRDPGIYYTDPTMTFDDAIALAGGATEDGNLEKVRLIRNGKEIDEDLDISRSVEAAVQSGDQLFVPKVSWFNRNGAILIGAGISALGVIVAFTN